MLPLFNKSVHSNNNKSEISSKELPSKEMSNALAISENIKGNKQLVVEE